MKCLKNILSNFEFMTKNHPYKIKMDYFSLDGFSFGGLLEYILQHALAKFQPATTCNSQNTSQNTQKHQKHPIVLSKPVALYFLHSIHAMHDDVFTLPPSLPPSLPTPGELKLA